ncbi:MAG: deoxyribose-phosphate aldolase, partial [Gemmatimonadales bacterium]|nr:deoxyribose-phosphate aldolase [Gemmatimonadales bacterium]
ATSDSIRRLCDEAMDYEVKAVCVNGTWVRACADRLDGSGVLVVAVVGFPLGAMVTAAKSEETARARADGAAEVDMVIQLGRLLEGDAIGAADDIRGVVAAAEGVAVKVILETAALDAPRIELGCALAQEAGARFVKTSTGFHPAGGATPDAVRLMRRTVGRELGVKASGGIRSAKAALALLAAGANRIGLSGTAVLAPLMGPGAPTLGELFGATRASR